jgi:hypothetical protein
MNRRSGICWLRVRAIGLAISAVVGLTTAACASVDATPGPEPTATIDPSPIAATASPYKTSGATQPSETIEPEPSCFNIHVIIEPIPQTMDAMSRISTVIVAGTFDRYGPTRWNTPDGVRPSQAMIQRKPARLIRPLLVTVDTTLRGQGVPLGAAQVRGGELGCDRVDYSDEIDLAVGSRYVFYLGPVGNSDGVVGTRLQLSEAWSLGSDNVARTRLEGPQPISEITTVAQSNPYTGHP